MQPPRTIVRESDRRLHTTYDGIVREHNLKAVLTRVIHPPHLQLETSAHFAAHSTGSFEEGAGNGRRGGEFFTNKDTEDAASGIFFQCLLWSITMPSAMFQIFMKCDADLRWKAVAPLPAEFSLFERRVRQLEWASRLLHPVFNSSFSDFDDYLGWLGSIARRGKELVKRSIVEGRGDRKRTAALLKMHLNSVGDKSFDDFQVQIIMRTVECCCHEPFGKVLDVAGGYGGSDGAKCMLKACLEREFGDTPASMEERWKKVAGWLVKMMNERARAHLKSRSETERHRGEMELEVLGLEWSDNEDCLVHKIGIKKKYDASDAEHGLCALYVLLCTVRPARNMSVESRIDAAKYFPVISPMDEGTMRDEAVMEPLKRRHEIVVQTFWKLIEDEGYEHRTMDHEFTLDVTEEHF